MSVTLCCHWRAAEGRRIHGHFYVFYTELIVTVMVLMQKDILFVFPDNMQPSGHSSVKCCNEQRTGLLTSVSLSPHSNDGVYAEHARSHTHSHTHTPSTGRSQCLFHNTSSSLVWWIRSDYRLRGD